MKGFCNEEISKSEVLDVVCAMGSFETVDEDDNEEYLQSAACQLSFQHVTDTDVVSAATKQKEEKRAERMRVKKEKVVSAS
jgi:hypothetical protein